MVGQRQTWPMIAFSKPVSLKRKPPKSFLENGGSLGQMRNKQNNVFPPLLEEIKHLDQALKNETRQNVRLRK